jgi:penicillin amidase
MLRKIIFGLVSFVILIIVSAYLFLLAKKPQYQGILASNHLQDSVKVYHDEYGIPHIYANNAEDAYFTLGYLHAQERLFQMEMIKRLASGRLAEVVGEKALKSDKFFRTIGISQQAKKAANDFLSSKKSPYQKASWAYIDGINEFIEKGATPLEFHIMGIPKEKFTAEDIYHTIGFMAFGFADGFREDPLFTQVKNQLGVDYLKDIMPENDAKLISVQQPDSALAITASLLAENFSQIFDELPAPMWMGSNGWAIAGDKTKTGKPMLANDTHIGYSQPSVWFDAHIEYPGFRFYGQHAAGIPFGVLGHNEHLGWGFTMFENDDVDLFTEEIKDDKYLFKNEWHSLNSRTEIIKVKGSEEVSLKVDATHHGPIVNNIFDELDSSNNPISVWWAYTQFSSTVVGALYDLNHAENIDHAAEAASKIPAPGLNLMYADDENIAWWALAKIPIRPDHVNSKLIMDGISGNDDYLGYYPFSKNPHNINPESGIVYTTNNQPDSVDGVSYPGYYRPKDRAIRVKNLLSQDKKWDIANHQIVQLDITSPTDPGTAKALGELIKNIDGDYQWIIDQLMNWDGSHTMESLEPGLYYTLLSQIFYHAIGDEMGYEDYKKISNSAAMRGSFLHFIENEKSIWWDDINTEGVESRNDIIHQAVIKSLNLLADNYGDDFEKWEWSKMHQLTHKHPLAAVKPLDKIFNVGPFPIEGGLELPNNQKFKLDTTGVYQVDAGAAIRWVVDFDDIENSVGILPTGQSGNLMSDHYDDQAQMFVDGNYRKQMMNKDEIINSSRNLLILKPSN